MAVNRDGGTWDGGYISLGAKGKKTYFIQRNVDGVRFHVSTRCHNGTAAHEHLRRFEADPRGYSPAGEVKRQPLVLTTALVLEHRDWNLAPPKPNSQKHSNEVAHLLADWMEDLSGIDLREVTLRQLKESVERRKVREQHRIIAIKSFYSWLRKEKCMLTSAEDPTLDLSVPQGSPEKHRRKKAVPVEIVRKVFRKLPPDYGDVLLVMANTGMHVSELERFIRGSESRILMGRRGKTLAALQVWHKKGDWHAYAVTDASALAAAERLKARGSVPRRMNMMLKAACLMAGVPEFTYGVMRHSVATWLKQKTGDSSAGAKLLGHEDEDTTDTWYADVDIPTTKQAVPSLVLVPKRET